MAPADALDQRTQLQSGKRFCRRADLHSGDQRSYRHFHTFEPRYLAMQAPMFVLGFLATLTAFDGMCAK
jgi:hypothetical protein